MHNTYNILFNKYYNGKSCLFYNLGCSVCECAVVQFAQIYTYTQMIVHHQDWLYLMFHV